MRKIYVFIIILLSIYFLFSCSSMYIPPMVNIPLHENKGECQIDVGAGTNSFYFSGNYAFTDKYALQVNGNASFHNFSNYYDILTDKDRDTYSPGGLFEIDYDWGEFSHQYGEIGFGRYNILNSVWKFETFAGYGYGYGYDEFENLYNHYNLGYIQGNLGRKIPKRNFEFGFACRISYSEFNFEYTNDNDERKTLIFDNISIEPNAFYRVGTETVRFYSKLGFNLMYSFESFDGINLYRGIKNEDLNYTGLHCSIGINIRLGHKKKT